MTAATPVASRKTRPSLDFASSPLSDRTRRLFPSILSPPLVRIDQDDAEESPSSSSSPIVLLRTGGPGEDSSTSSPIVSISNDDPKQDLKTATYRSTIDLPHELETHCNIYLEERLYDKAIILLNNLLVSGTSYPIPKKAWLPPKNQIAFISTLLVHPTFTTRATPSERGDISSQALILLRNILSLLGPSNAKLYEAFVFRSKVGLQRSRRTERAALPNPQRVPYGEDPINSKLASDGSLWLRAQDFWQVVGWAFNCSIHHQGRWNVWKVWLEYMLDVIEADWNYMLNIHDEEYMEKKRADPEAMDEMFQNCILIRYISDGARSSTALRRIVKSIFADGSVDALKAYPEVFKDETREANAKTGTKRKREVKLSLDKDEYGDYFQNEDDDDNSPTPSQSEVSSPSATEDSSIAPCAARTAENPEAVIIRLRLLALLSLASFTAPCLFVPIGELYKVYVEVIKPLPLPAFALFVSPSAMPHLPLVALSSIVQAHLSQLLPWSAPRPDDDSLNQENLERCFLPFAANTSSVEDNAKVSVLIETLFRLLATHGGIEYTAELMAAVDKGIKAREKKCTGTRKKKSGSAKDEEDMYWLNASAERMKLLLGRYGKVG